MQEKLQPMVEQTEELERIFTKEEKRLMREYRTKYKNLTRGRLSQENHRLYLALYRNKLLDIVPRKFAPIEDPVALYRKEYVGMRQGQLKIENKRLYDALESAGLLHVVPTDERIINDPVMFYHMRYAHVTRTQLLIEDNKLHTMLKEMGKLDIVPKKYMEPLAEYQQKHAGVNQTVLRKTQPSLYQRLWRKGLLVHVPK